MSKFGDLIRGVSSPTPKVEAAPAPEPVVEEVVEEATKLSDNVAEPKGGDADNNESPLTKKPAGTKVEGAGEPVAVKDGGEGNKGEGAKDHTPTDNINVEPKKA